MIAISKIFIVKEDHQWTFIQNHQWIFIAYFHGRFSVDFQRICSGYFQWIVQCSFGY